jgi:hypothetical protein
MNKKGITLGPRRRVPDLLGCQTLPSQTGARQTRLVRPGIKDVQGCAVSRSR